MKQPQDCQNIQDIRIAIDNLDREIIQIFGQRLEYVNAAAKFKSSTENVQASDRVQKMLQQRRLWAVENNLNPDIIEKLYRDLVNYFINEELKHWQEETKI